jgi:DNA-binding NarL/FixJ family response regulator
VRILVFSMHSDPIIGARALEAGAAGYVLKDTSSEDLIEAFPNHEQLAGHGARPRWLRV